MNPAEVNNPKIFIKLYEAMIRPIGTYGCEVWAQQFIKALSGPDFQPLDLYNSI